MFPNLYFGRDSKQLPSSCHSQFQRCPFFFHHSSLLVNLCHNPWSYLLLFHAPFPNLLCIFQPWKEGKESRSALSNKNMANHKYVQWHSNVLQVFSLSFLLFHLVFLTASEHGSFSFFIPVTSLFTSVADKIIYSDT